MARLIPIAEALSEDLDAAAANRARIARLNTRRSAMGSRSYTAGESPNDGASQRMSREHRSLLKYSTRGMNRS